MNGNIWNDFYFEHRIKTWKWKWSLQWPEMIVTVACVSSGLRKGQAGSIPVWNFSSFWIISTFIFCKWSGKLAFTVSNQPKFYHHHPCRRHLCEGFCLQDFCIQLILWESNIVNTVSLAALKRSFMAVSKEQLISAKDALHSLTLYRKIIS